MDISLEQFIPSNKSKQMTTIFKYVGILIFIVGLFCMIFIAPLIGIVLEIVAIVLIISNFFSYVDYEYELYNGNIDISKIYSCRKRTLAIKIKKEDVENVYHVSQNDAGKGGVKVFFNSNLKDLEIYTFELQGNIKVQVALNKELEKIVKITYREKMNH